MKCKVCGKRIKLQKKNRYECVKYPEGVVGALTQRTIIYEAFDCEYCGCQNIVNVREQSRLDMLKECVEDNELED